MIRIPLTNSTETDGRVTAGQLHPLHREPSEYARRLAMTYIPGLDAANIPSDVQYKTFVDLCLFVGAKYSSAAFTHFSPHKQWFKIRIRLRRRPNRRVYSRVYECGIHYRVKGRSREKSIPIAMCTDLSYIEGFFRMGHRFPGTAYPPFQQPEHWIQLSEAVSYLFAIDLKARRFKRINSTGDIIARKRYHIQEAVKSMPSADTFTACLTYTFRLIQRIGYEQFLRDRQSGALEAVRTSRATK